MRSYLIWKYTVTYKFHIAARKGKDCSTQVIVNVWSQLLLSYKEDRMLLARIGLLGGEGGVVENEGPIYSVSKRQ
jgi:hypothetical protein